VSKTISSTYDGKVDCRLDKRKHLNDTLLAKKERIRWTGKDGKPIRNHNFPSKRVVLVISLALLAFTIPLAAILVLRFPTDSQAGPVFVSQVTLHASASPTATGVPKNTSVPTAIPTPTPGTSPRSTSTPPPTQPSGGERTRVQITFYGSYDNDPPGSTGIAHPVLHQKAGGTGTYNDPLTFASPAGEGAYAWGTRIYVPLVQKYFIREDECAESWTAPEGCGPVTHVDLYMGNPSNRPDVVDCEEALTPNGKGTIILNPPSNLPYDPTPLWSQSNGNCMMPHV
jgi:hypothetical protein